MTAAIAILRVTARNVLGLRRMVGFGLLAVFPGAIYLLVSRQSSELGKAESFTGLSIFVLLGVVVPIITIVMAGSVLGSERREDTLSFLMLRPLSRYAIAASKLGSAIVASFAITAVGALVIGALGSIALRDFGYLVALLIATLIATIGYSAVFMPLGYLTERATLIGFIYLFVWETAIAGIVTGLSGTSLFRISTSAYVGLAPDRLDQSIVGDSLGALAAGAGGAAAKMLVLAALSVAITGSLLRSRDLI